jgi:hypothetical protein
MERTTQSIYSRNIGLLDNFLEESLKEVRSISSQQEWKKVIIHRLFSQATNVMFCLLSNSEESKFQNESYVTDAVLFGALARIVRDIYLNIVYLKTNALSDEQMKACWRYQVVRQKIKTIKHTGISAQPELLQLGTERTILEKILDTIPFCDNQHKKSVYNGRCERALNLAQIANIKGFDEDYFKSEFVFFSQFAHSTAYANNFQVDEGIPQGLVTAIYDKVIAYFIGIAVESIELLLPAHPQLQILLISYQEVIKNRWTR